MNLVEKLLETKGVGIDNPSTNSSFSLAEAYKLAHELNKLQLAQGKTLAGRKIGISNRAAWPTLGLSDIVWGYVYTDTVMQASDNHFSLSLAGYQQPKLEPEIVFGLKAPLPSNSRNAAELLESVEWMALGFEVVQCPYPDWKFKPADLVATFGFHGALIIGDRVELTADMADAFVSCQASLKRDSETIETGAGTNVVDSPAIALGHLADLVYADSNALAIGETEIITTGTLTAAPSIKKGETYTATVTGLGLPKLRLELI